MVLLRPSVLLRIEGAVLFAMSLLFYARGEGGWVTFLLLVLAPDLSMLGYLAGPQAGAAVYNLFHIYAGPVVLLALGVDQPPLVSLALIWLAHIGADRLLGFGLKYPTAFKDTHLQRV